MPPLAGIGTAIGGAITTAVGGLTLSGLATGAMVVGTGMSLLGQATGSKTLSNIGMGIGLAGGVGAFAGSLRGASAITAGSTKGGMSFTDDVLSTSIKGKPDLTGFKTFSQTGAATAATDSFANAAGKINFNPASMGWQPPTAGGLNNFLQRTGDTLTKYSVPMMVLGGVGDAYMKNEEMDLSRELLDKKLAFEQQGVDWLQRNNGTRLGVNPMPTLTRNVNAYAPLLQISNR